MKRKRRCHNCIWWEYDDGFRRFGDCSVHSRDVEEEDPESKIMVLDDKQNTIEASISTKSDFGCNQHEYIGCFSKTEARESGSVGKTGMADWEKVKRYYNE